MHANCMLLLATSFCHIDSYVVRDAVNVEAISPCFAWYGQCRRRTRGHISIANMVIPRGPTLTEISYAQITNQA